MTPDSDSEDDAIADPGPGLPLGPGHGDSSEVYELQDRRREEQSGSDDNDDDEKDGLHELRRRRRWRAGSASTAASFTLYTPDEERAVVRKFDRKLVVFVALLYMLSFLDRSSQSALLRHVSGMQN